jgi:hypothetical protein
MAFFPLAAQKQMKTIYFICNDLDKYCYRNWKDCLWWQILKLSDLKYECVFLHKGDKINQQEFMSISPHIFLLRSSVMNSI